MGVRLEPSDKWPRTSESDKARPSGEAGPGEEGARWKRFTPSAVDASKCLARTWNEGRGGQCQRNSQAGKDLCQAHAKKVGAEGWLGMVTGRSQIRSWKGRSWGAGANLDLAMEMF